MGKMSAIVVAAGSGERFGGGENKVFAVLDGQPIFLRALQLFVNREDVAQTILVVAPADMEQMKNKFGANLGFMGVKLVEGGAERHDSVANALAAVSEDAEFVAVHDAVRVCVAVEWIDQVFEAAVNTGAAAPICPVTSTLKRVDKDGIITETVSREGLHMAQTPQVFRKDWLVGAYDDFKSGAIGIPEGVPLTDDAQLVAAAGHPVAGVRGDPRNIKITTKGDLVLASAVLKALPQKPVARRGAFEEAKW
ncbi:MAG TPA: 2-C-methyl-D-erythritol 4-phosphate cytidylyltransferase [Phycisphaerae bacterium]|nr:2-C-methyl-D-erythritol 4-phosphate cytidylyltransferase [Phycisphaerae bacterium]